MTDHADLPNHIAIGPIYWRHIGKTRYYTRLGTLEYRLRVDHDHAASLAWQADLHCRTLCPGAYWRYLESTGTHSDLMSVFRRGSIVALRDFEELVVRATAKDE